MSPGRMLLCCLLALPLAASAQSAGYTLDPVHTRVLVAVSHAGFSHALGTVSGSTGTLLFDPDDWSSAKLTVSVPMARLDLGDGKWNATAAGRNLLDVAGHPVATFVSTRIEPKDPTHASVCGTLALRGVQREVCLDVTFNQLKRHPMPPFRRTAGFSATATLGRKAFGIDTWQNVIGDSVALRIEAEAIRGGRVDATDAATGDATGNESTSSDEADGNAAQPA
ncbi:MAG: YceI family protein, partial [Luteimonas sp.]